MDPLTIMIASGVMTSLVQLYQSEKARGAETKRLNELKQMFDNIKPPDYDVSIDQPPELHAEALQLPKFSDPAQAPKFNMNALTPEALQVVGKFNPQLTAFVEQAAPQLIEQSADMKKGREAQNKALEEYLRVGADDFDPRYQQAVQEGSRKAQSDAQSRQQSIMENFRQRGLANSGLELGAQMQGSSQAMDRAASTNLDAASQAYQNRMQALASGADLGGQISAQDQNMQNVNANILNSFNEKMAAGKQANMNQNTAMVNAAQQANLANEQRVSDQNVGNRNAAAEADRARQDQLQQYLYSIDQGNRDKADSNSVFNYNAGLQQRDYENNVATQQATWAAQQKAKANAMKSQQYSDLLEQAKGKMGISNQVGANAIGQAQDRNAAVGGLGQLGQIYGGTMMSRQNAERSTNNAAGQDRQKAAMAADLNQYKSTGSYMTPDEYADYQKKLNPDMYYKGTTTYDWQRN